MKMRGQVAIGVVAAVLVVVGAVVVRRALAPHAATTQAVTRMENSVARAPAGVRVRVEVLNTTRTRGLARRATEYLRDLGYDVVAIGTQGPARDSSLVIVRTGHADWARPLADAVQPAAVENRPDSSRYVDVSVLLGTSWRPPAQPLYP